LLYINIQKLKDATDESTCGESADWFAFDSSYGLKVASVATSLVTEMVKLLFRAGILPLLIRLLKPKSHTSADAYRMMIAGSLSAMHLGFTFIIAVHAADALPMIYEYSSSYGKIDYSKPVGTVMCRAYGRYAVMQRFYSFCFSTLLSSSFSVLVDEFVQPKVWATRVVCWNRKIVKGASQEQLDMMWAAPTLDMWLLHVYSAETLFTTLLVASVYPVVVLAGAFNITMLYIFFRISLLRVRPRKVFEIGGEPHSGEARSVRILTLVGILSCFHDRSVNEEAVVEFPLLEEHDAILSLHNVVRRKLVHVLH
jgi:hypothetical protein